MDSGVALTLNVGVPVAVVGPGTVVLEGEFSYSLVAPSYEWYYAYYGEYRFAEAYFATIGAYAGYVFDINKNLYVKPRIGLVNSSNDDEDAYSVTTIAFGAGAGYRLNKAMDIYLDYTMLDGSYFTHTTLGVNYHF